ncbi:MAG: Rieske (2Fe-2S) protein [Gammaproteobacteria bacterium]|nr:MAG: Rieske (2Fe-2S) protein [Gammaproteobacteria bacterium]
MIPLCRVDELNDPGSRGFALQRGGEPVEIFLVRRGALVRGYVNHCPHRGMPLEWQPDQFLDEAGERIVCATHGALFALEDGRCLGGPCRGAGLEPIPLSVEDGVIHVEGPDWEPAP